MHSIKNLTGVSSSFQIVGSRPANTQERMRKRKVNVAEKKKKKKKENWKKEQVVGSEGSLHLTT